MEAAQYWIALLTIVTMAPVALAWFIIHPFARVWRRAGLGITYTVVLALVLVQGAGLVLIRRWLLSVHYGVSWPLIAAAIVFTTASWAMAIPRFRQLTPAMTIGVPEVSPKGPGKLLTEGIYAYIRHPRYVEIWLALIGLAFFANYLATYVLLALYWPVVYAIVLLEERELRDRFGEAYEEYRRKTPRFVPRLRGGGE
jgi:protein-S-isoprenylcysteine O-methyltransferase Ste14